MRPIAVIAGTPVDTRMGADYLRLHAPELTAALFPVSPSPQETHLLQIAPEAEKDACFDRLFSEAEAAGCRDFFLYCNSLSACFDFEALAKRRGDRIVTPLMIYRRLASRYSRLAVIAANSQAAAYIHLLNEDSGDVTYGVGVSSNITRASVRAIFSALNRLHLGE